MLRVFDVRRFKIISAFRSTRNPIEMFRAFASAQIVHIQISRTSKIFIAILAKIARKKVVYTHHNTRDLEGLAFYFLCLICDHMILVNKNSQIPFRAMKLCQNRLSYIPAFLPPEESRSLPEALVSKISRFDKIISTNCFRYVPCDNGDLYGLNVIIEAFYLLSTKDHTPKTVLVIVDPSGTTKDYLANLLRGKNFRDNHVELVFGPIDFSSLIRSSCLTVRATWNDGDSLSVRESLYFGTPVLASDVTERPDGTFTFRCGDATDLAAQMENIIGGDEKPHRVTVDFHRDIIDIYRRLAGP